MRLIDADRLLRDPYFKEDRFPCSHLIRMAVGEQRTVDAVRVIRCKGCQYHEPCKPYNKVWCPKMGRYMKQDGFCSEGVAKDV